MREEPELILEVMFAWPGSFQLFRSKVRKLS